MNILTIGGSDPSAGAGIQSDLKTFSQLGCYGLCVVTAVTSQNTSKFFKYDAVPAKIVASQLDAVLEDFKINAIKVSMVANKEIIKTIHGKLKNIKVPIVVDPVIRSTTGGNLIDADSMKHYKKYLVPLSYVITPNVSEAYELTGIVINDRESLVKSARMINDNGAKNVVITGFGIEKNKIADVILDKKEYRITSGKKIPNVNHGSGCNYSAAMSVALSKRADVFRASDFARQFSLNSITNAKKIGKGIPVTNYVNTIDLDELGMQLSNAINKFTKIKNVNQLIPECQTNFVYSDDSPKSLNDVVGLDGRIVRAGNSAIVAGKPTHGGSKHVATAVFTINKKFPETRSAVNVKYDEKLVKTIKNLGFQVTYYDRVQEPQSAKKTHSSVSWGVQKAIEGVTNPPDVVYHLGDFGKEPMILIFGNSPDKVLAKVRKIAKAYL